MYSFPHIKQEKLLPREKILDLEIKRIENAYKVGWLYIQCKEQDLLQAYKNIEEQGFFNILRNGDSESASSATAPKLSIELVPRTSWFSNVRSEVSKIDWDVIRKAAFKKAQHCCEICGNKGAKWPVECHEIWHYDDDRKIQRLSGFIALCPSCHEVKHMGLSQLKGKGSVALAHLAIVNKWNYIRAKKYVDRQFTVWEERSNHNWELDIKLLENSGVKFNNAKNLSFAEQAALR